MFVTAQDYVSKLQLVLDDHFRINKWLRNSYVSKWIGKNIWSNYLRIEYALMEQDIVDL